MKFMLTARSGQAYACNWALLALCYEYSLGNIKSPNHKKLLPIVLQIYEWIWKAYSIVRHRIWWVLSNNWKKVKRYQRMSYIYLDLQQYLHSIFSRINHSKSYLYEYIPTYFNSHESSSSKSYGNAWWPGACTIFIAFFDSSRKSLDF